LLTILAHELLVSDIPEPSALLGSLSDDDLQAAYDHVLEQFALELLISADKNSDWSDGTLVIDANHGPIHLLQSALDAVTLEAPTEVGLVTSEQTSQPSRRFRPSFPMPTPTASRSASPTKPVLPAFALLLLGVPLQAQPPAIRDLFPPKAVSACALPVREVRERSTIYQVFTKSGAPRELFRIPVGHKIDGEWVKLWRYGIHNCGDFNRDSILDYTWYGGDDTGGEYLLLLSSPIGFRKISIEQTLQRHWTRTRRGKPPDFGSNAFDRQRITLEYAAGKLILHLSGQQWTGPGNPKITMAVEDTAWVAEP